MQKAADLYRGRSKTDARDAFIIADTARTMPHTLRAVDRDSEVLSALKVLSGSDEDLGSRNHEGVESAPVSTYANPPCAGACLRGRDALHGAGAGFAGEVRWPHRPKNAGRGKVLRFARSRSRGDPEVLIDHVFIGLGEQSVIVPATAAVEIVIPRVAGQIKELKAQRATVAREVEAMLEGFPLASVLMSMPGIVIKTAAQILLDIGDGTAFETAGHLAAYAGIAPVTRRSGTSIRGEFPARSGNKRLKNALFHSAWVASNHDPISKAYYDSKHAEGKGHDAAVNCLARRSCNVIFAMLRDGTYYQPPAPTPSPAETALAA